MVAFLKSIAEDKRFSNFIIGVILFAGVLVGVQTYPSLEHEWHGLLHLLDQIILWVEQRSVRHNL